MTDQTMTPDEARERLMEMSNEVDARLAAIQATASEREQDLHEECQAEMQARGGSPELGQHFQTSMRQILVDFAQARSEIVAEIDEERNALFEILVDDLEGALADDNGVVSDEALSEHDLAIKLEQGALQRLQKRLAAQQQAGNSNGDGNDADTDETSEDDSEDA